jgi:hypothetical protein
MRTLLVTACLLLLASSAALAQLEDRTSLEISDIKFGRVGIAEFDLGQADLQLLPLRFSSPVPWRITVEATSNNLGFSDDGSYVKPLTDLQFKLSTDNDWTRLRQIPETLATGEAGRDQLFTDWRTLLDWTKDRPGRYRVELLFTISAD